jgi:proton-translocating NAD(P)+ transhydrogenase subunit alpha
VAVVLATLNMVGGFVVTDRMLEMFGRGAPADRSLPQGKPANGDSGEAA